MPRLTHRSPFGRCRWVGAVRAVSLGGWVVTEGWIFSPLFGDILNKNLLDGTQLRFKSALRKTYITADQGGGGAILATNLTQPSDYDSSPAVGRLVQAPASPASHFLQRPAVASRRTCMLSRFLP
nr:unnamed protein product [Digitaria exilis]